ncbi:MAG TPA: glycerol-3-phosphate 1-O-acyltransferase PlsY [Clostridiales bacterium]|jgi:glycerol-3-phosphate acyltransferase PlsY|nr:glycerol-3-phosphate 1-O-acyltransferase PlsY [Clostridiales bacterium]
MSRLLMIAAWLVDLQAIFKLPLIALIAYLLGSFNTSIVVSKVALKKDIRDYGSGNAGFTNAVRSMGVKRGMLVMLGDITKCALAVLIGQLIYSGNMSFDAGAAGRLLAGAFVFLGHIYPVYFGFRGGKGVLTYAITMVFFDWRIFIIGMSVFFLIALTTKFISLGSILASMSLPLMVFLFSRTNLTDQDMALGYTLVAAFMSGLLVFKHRENIVRLVNGTESKFSFKGKALMEEDEPSEADDQKSEDEKIS